MKKSLCVLMCCAAPFPALADVLDCVIKPKALIEISSGKDGRILEIAFSRGDSVQAGDLLVQLDDTQARLQLEVSEARAADMGEIRSQETRLEFRKKELERASELSSRNVTSEAVREDAEIEVALTELAVDEARLAQHLARLEVKQAEAELARRRIESPVDGVITEVEASPGEYATEQTVLMTIAEIDPLYVEVFAPLKYLKAFAVGQRHVVSLAEPLTGDVDATVTVVNSVLDAASGTFGVRLEIPNPHRAIAAGVRCRLPSPVN